MSSHPILLCDVDQCVVDLGYEWFKFLRSIVKDKDFSYEEVAKYYNFQAPLADYVTFEEAHSFWKRENLYDKAVPMDGAADVLWRLKREHGFDIVFASHVEGNHAKSKFEFLKRYFPVDGFMATREKHYARANVVIDDRLDNLVCHPDDVVKILKNTPHAQTLLTSFESDSIIYEWNCYTVDLILDAEERKRAIHSRVPEAQRR